MAKKSKKEKEPKKQERSGPHMAKELLEFLATCRRGVDEARQLRDFEYTDLLGNVHKIGLSIPMLAARASIGDGTTRKFLGPPYCAPEESTKSPSIRVLWNLMRAVGKDLKVVARQTQMDQSDEEVILSMTRIHYLARNGLLPKKLHKEIVAQVEATKAERAA